VAIETIPTFAEAYLSLGEEKGVRVAVAGSEKEPVIEIYLPDVISVNGFKSRRQNVEAKVLNLLMAASRTSGIGVTSLVSQGREKERFFNMKRTVRGIGRI